MYYCASNVIGNWEMIPRKDININIVNKYKWLLQTRHIMLMCSRGIMWVENLYRKMSA